MFEQPWQAPKETNGAPPEYEVGRAQSSWESKDPHP